MHKIVLITGVAIMASLTIAADCADAFGGRGYARRQSRRSRRVSANVVHRVPVVSYYSTPVVTYPPPVYHQPSVSVGVIPHDTYYPSGHYQTIYPSVGSVSVEVSR